MRAAVVHPDCSVEHVKRRALPPSVPALGLVEFDPAAMAASALDAAREALADSGPVEGVGVATQRASVVAWDAATGRPLGPGIGWQDLRTAGTCLELQGEGLRFSPSESATKFAWLLTNYGQGADKPLRLGTVDSWIVWCLSEGSAHVSDLSNAGVTGLLDPNASQWRQDLLDRLGIPLDALPALVDSSAQVASATSLPGSPPICGIAGDQQASLMGQGATLPGLAKATFGTGGMLDICLGASPPPFEARGAAGCFPIVAWRRAGQLTWGAEAIMLSAGSAVDWLVEDLGIIGSAAESDQLAATCSDAGGVVVVPDLLGTGTPTWDFGARGAVLGFSRGTGKAQLVRAVLEGVAQRGADLLEAAEADTGLHVESLRVDGGMSANQTFLQALADACGRPVEVSPQLEATTLGAGYLAGLAVGTWASEQEVAAAWKPRVVLEPKGPSDRERWAEACKRASRWYPELSALEF